MNATKKPRLDISTFKQTKGAVSQVAKSRQMDVRYDEGITHKWTKEKPLTMPRAQEHLEHAEVPEEREAREYHVNFLVDQAVNGNFRQEDTSMATALDLETGTIYRVNGQHTSWMRLFLGTSTKFDFKVRWHHYECENMDAVRRLYATFDRNRSRNEAHLVHVGLCGEPGFDGFSKKTISLLRSAIRMFLWETSGENQKHSSDEVVQLMKGEYKDLCMLVGNFLSTCTRNDKHLCKAGIVAAMYATYQRKPKISAEEFWPVVRDGVSGDALEKNDPRFKLFSELKGIVTHTKGHGTLGDRKIVTNEELYRGIIRAWRTWRSGKTLSVVKWSSGVGKPRPIPN